MREPLALEMSTPPEAQQALMGEAGDDPLPLRLREPQHRGLALGAQPRWYILTATRRSSSRCGALNVLASIRSISQA